MLLDVYSWDLVSLGKDTLTWEQDNKAMMWHLQGIPTIHRNIFCPPSKLLQGFTLVFALGLYGNSTSAVHVPVAEQR